MILKSKKYKVISMMRGKSPPPELILEVIKSKNSLRFLKEFGKGDHFYLCQNIIFHVYFDKNGKTQHNKSLYFNTIKICHFYSLM